MKYNKYLNFSVKDFRTVSRDKLELLWPYQPVCILLFDSFMSLMTEQVTNHDELILGKDYTSENS